MRAAHRKRISIASMTRSTRGALAPGRRVRPRSSSRSCARGKGAHSFRRCRGPIFRTHRQHGQLERPKYPMWGRVGECAGVRGSPTSPGPCLSSGGGIVAIWSTSGSKGSADFALLAFLATLGMPRPASAPQACRQQRHPVRCRRAQRTGACTPPAIATATDLMRATALSERRGTRGSRERGATARRARRVFHCA